MEMAPPPPRNPNAGPSSLPPPEGSPRAESSPATAPVASLPEETESAPAGRPNSSAAQTSAAAVPYSIPEWSAIPEHPFSLEVLKEGSIFQQLDVSKKGAYMFGRVDLCDFVLEHPTISRFHAVLQFRNDGKVFIYDCGSTHGTRVNKSEIKKKIYTQIHVGDVIKFGLSTRLYIFQGPSELMPPEGDLQRIRDARARQEEYDREASIRRARKEVSMAEGISWGMGEDAVEEADDNDADELTWQNYQGQLTERQEKTRSKIIKRMEKVANMRKEIDAIRVKDIPQGGLTQGQQTQIARNEQRIMQIMEELDNLEETLNDSIRESLGAKTRKSANGKNKGSIEDEDDVLSDEDEFYDRTKKKQFVKKLSDQLAVETADTLLDKKDAIISNIEANTKLLEAEKSKLGSEGTSLVDDLDAYMTGLSSQLVRDKILEIEKDITNYQAELDKILYLLKIADPMGEALQMRSSKLQVEKVQIPRPEVERPSQESCGIAEISESNITSHSHSAAAISCEEVQKEVKATVIEAVVVEDKEIGKPSFTIPKPQWLGAKRNLAPLEDKIESVSTDREESDNFVDYKDRKVALPVTGDAQDLENAAPGLILRKRKLSPNAPASADSTSTEAESSVAGAVALLLKHNSGYHSLYDDLDDNQLEGGDKLQLKSSKARRSIGPSRHDFLGSDADADAWVPPKGQTGDGRTALNDRLGY